MFTARELIVIELALANRRNFLSDNSIPAADEKILEVNRLLNKVRTLKGSDS